jgi:hypothetical protein
MDSADDHPDLTFAAVGRAITMWEIAEVEFARLYSIFTGRPNLIDAYQEYGAEPTYFDKRMSRLCEEGRKYFIKQSSQTNEANLDALIQEGKALARIRHQIAHGIIRAFPIYGDPDENGIVSPQFGYFIVAPYYSLVTLTKHDKTSYHYASNSLDEFAKQFALFAEKIRSFALVLQR